MNNDIVEYINEVQEYYDGVLGEIQAEALEEGIPIIPHETARLLSVLLTMKKPKNVLEIGTAVGFSAGLIAKYLKPDGSIITIDRYDYMIKKAKENIGRMGLKDTIKLIEGDALSVLESLTDKFDFIFLDAAKGQYQSFLPHILRLLDKGGLFIADDILQGGDVAKTKYSVERRQRTIHKRLRAFIWSITHSEELETAIVPIGDGLAVCYKK